MDDDWKQIETYVSSRQGAERAFAAIVERYLGLVFSAALRQVNDRTGAEEVTQAVFVLLAQKASKLKPSGSLAAWLYSAASLKAKEYLRSDIARRKREQKAYDMATDSAPADEDDDLDWDRVAPLLDAAMGELPQRDREAVLMRYFQDLPLRDVGETLGVSEDTARKRVSRAVDRLRLWFAERGVAFSATSLLVALSTHSAEAAPAHLLGATLKTVAAETATATSTSALTTAMASTKMTAVTAVLVGAAIPISIGLFDSKPSDVTEVPLPVSVPSVDRIALPEAADSALIAEWKRLRSQFGPDAGSMPELFGAIRDIEDDFRRRTFRNALLAEWAVVDPEGAVAFLKVGDRGLLDQLFGDWLRQDSAAAIDAMIAGGSELAGEIKEHIGYVATVSPADLAALAPFVKKTRPWDLAVEQAFSQFARDDMEAARAAAEGVSGVPGAEAMAGVAKAWAESDAEAALAWVEGIDDQSARDRSMQALLIGWAKMDPVAALDRISLAPAGGGQMTHGWDTASQVVNAAAGADFERTLEWMADNPASGSRTNGYGGLDSEVSKRFLSDVAGTLELVRDSRAQEPLKGALLNVLLNQGFSQRDEMWDWIVAQPESEFVDEMRLSLIRSAAYKKPAAAVDWIQSLPEEIAAGLDYRTVASSLLNGGHQRERLDGLLERVGESPLRQALLESGVAEPTADLDVKSWIGRLDEFSDEARPNAVTQIANSWSLTDPEAAITWASSLEEGRGEAFRGLATGWAGADGWGASQWIAGLDEGADRDQAISGMVDEIVKSDPVAAWEWAKAVSSPEVQESVMINTIRAVAKQRAGDAAQMLEDAGLPDDVSSGLRDEIDRHRIRQQGS